MHAKQPASEHTKHVSAKVDRDLFQRLLIAAEMDEKLTLTSFLQSELTPSPFSLAHPDGSLRSTDKAALGCSGVVRVHFMGGHLLFLGGHTCIPHDIQLKIFFFKET